MYRNGLMRAAARIINSHCPGISKQNLRRAVAAVLVTAGYSSMDLKKNGDKFDRMLRPFPPDPSDEARKRAAKEFEERWGDRPI